MRLRPEQLNNHLQNSNLAPIYFVSGDEPLQKLECVDQLRMAARAQGYDERLVFDIDKSFDWNSINAASANLSLFTSKRIIELRMSSPKPGKEGGRVLLEYVEQLNKDNLLIISSDKLDKSAQNNKWVKAFEKAGVLIQIWPVAPAQLPGWIQNRMLSREKRITLDAARLIALRVEGNLLAAQQEIDKLILLIEKNDIDTEDVITAVADSSRYDVFDLIDSAFLGNANRTLHMLHGLRNEGIDPMAIFGAWMWEFRRVCSIAHQYESGSNLESLFKSYRVWDQKKRSVNAVLQRHSGNSFDKLLAFCATIDRTIKSSRREQAWDQFNTLLLAIAGVNTTKLQHS